MKIKQTDIHEASKLVQDLMERAEAQYRTNEIDGDYLDAVNDLRGIINTLCYVSDNGGSIEIDRDTLAPGYRDAYFERMLERNRTEVAA